jgi:glucose-1-phosphate cytidylyltransferase
MKAVILAGGFGTRLAEETDTRPKPMVEIGGKPILWHIMKLYSAAGVREFIICAGYKASVIKRYFCDYFLENSDVEVDTATGSVRYLSSVAEPWSVKIIDTGLETMTGGRLKKIAEHLDDGPFCMTYGDGLADLDVVEQIKFHKEHKKLATVLAVRTPGRFGILAIDDNDYVNRFHEKPDDDSGWINGGFFILEPKALNFINGNETIWEREPLEKLAELGELRAMKHRGFWKPMDTLRDKRELDKLWQENIAPWKR